MILDTPTDTGTSESELATQQAQDQLISEHQSFYWLLESENTSAIMSRAQFFYPMILLTECGTIIVYSTALDAKLLFEPSIYRGTDREWIVPIVSYDWLNPERTSRFVSIVLIIYLKIDDPLLFSYLS